MKDLNDIHLNKQQRQLLKRATFLASKTDSSRVFVAELQRYKEFDQMYFNDLVRLDLIRVGHLPDEDEQHGIYHQANGFLVTQRGLHYFDFHWQRVKDFWFRSVFVPIVVSLITSLLVTITAELLKQLM